MNKPIRFPILEDPLQNALQNAIVDCADEQGVKHVLIVLRNAVKIEHKQSRPKEKCMATLLRHLDFLIREMKHM
jgi:hypothetical protein